MEHSFTSKDFIERIKNPQLLSVLGAEKLSVGESVGLFFSEFGASIDRRLASFEKSVITLDVEKFRKTIQRKEILFVKNAGLPVIVPETYTPGLGNMMAYTQFVATDGVYLVSSMKTEAIRLYDWLKQLIKTGRPETRFRWTITNFDTVLDRSEQFLKGLPSNPHRKTCTLGEVYVNFEELYSVLETYNVSAKLLGARDVEMASRELSRVYELGQLLVEKIKTNDLVVDEKNLTEVELVVNRFVEFTDICGAMMTLLNELAAVFRDQTETIVTKAK